jgi:hypothetical protein
MSFLDKLNPFYYVKKEYNKIKDKAEKPLLYSSFASGLLLIIIALFVIFTKGMNGIVLFIMTFFMAVSCLTSAGYLYF